MYSWFHMYQLLCNMRLRLGTHLAGSCLDSAAGHGQSLTRLPRTRPQVGHAACMCIFTAMRASVKAVSVLFIECAGAFLGLLVLGTGER